MSEHLPGPIVLFYASVLLIVVQVIYIRLGAKTWLRDGAIVSSAIVMAEALVAWQGVRLQIVVLTVAVNFLLAARALQMSWHSPEDYRLVNDYAKSAFAVSRWSSIFAPVAAIALVFDAATGEAWGASSVAVLATLAVIAVSKVARWSVGEISNSSLGMEFESNRALVQLTNQRDAELDELRREVGTALSEAKSEKSRANKLAEENLKVMLERDLAQSKRDAAERHAGRLRGTFEREIERLRTNDAAERAGISGAMARANAAFEEQLSSQQVVHESELRRQAEQFGKVQSAFANQFDEQEFRLERRIGRAQADAYKSQQTRYRRKILQELKMLYDDDATTAVSLHQLASRQDLTSMGLVWWTVDSLSSGGWIEMVEDELADDWKRRILVRMTAEGVKYEMNEDARNVTHNYNASSMQVIQQNTAGGIVTQVNDLPSTTDRDELKAALAEVLAQVWKFSETPANPELKAEFAVASAELKPERITTQRKLLTILEGIQLQASMIDTPGADGVRSAAAAARAVLGDSSAP